VNNSYANTMFDDEDDMFSMGDDSMMLPLPPTNGGGGGGGGMGGNFQHQSAYGDDDMGMGGGMDMGLDGLDDGDDFALDNMALPPKPSNPKAAASSSGFADNNSMAPVIDLIDDDDDDAYASMNMPLPNLDAAGPPPRPSAPSASGTSTKSPAPDDISSQLMTVGLLDPYAPMSAIPALEFPDLSSPTVDYRAQAQIDPAEAMRQITSSMGLGDMPDMSDPDNPTPGAPNMPRYSTGPMAPMNPRASMGPMNPQMGVQGGGGGGGGGGRGALSGQMPFAPQMYQATSKTGPASDSFKDRAKYTATIAAENVEKTLEYLQLKKKDKAKHYVKAVLDKVRLDDPTLNEVNLSACRLNKGKLQSLVKSLRTNSQVKKLDFSNHGLAGGDGSVIYLAKHLQDNKAITWYADLSNLKCISCKAGFCFVLTCILLVSWSLSWSLSLGLIFV
jgi:hypothetical protein